MNNPFDDDPYIETYTGLRFRPQAPDPALINLEDIAHALSNKCRYTGHTRQFYSVAQHCVIVSHLVPEEYALEGLLHDGAEAYFPDIPYPLRSFTKVLNGMEDRIHEAVAKAFGLAFPFPDVVNEADRRVVVDEAISLMRTKGRDWPITYQPYGLTIKSMSPKMAKAKFLRRYGEITERNPR